MSKVNKKRGAKTSEKMSRTYFYLSLLVILPIIVNWKIVKYEFTGLDDKGIIVNNYDFLSDIKNISKAFEKDNFLSKDGNNYYRPIQTISFMVDAQINSEKPYIFHFSNLVYHILTVIVIFFLFRKLGLRDNISFYVALLFSVHPLFTDAIAWIPGRGDLLAGLFCSVSFLSFIYYNSTKNILFFIFHAFTFLLALFSKEISVFLPVLIIFYYWEVLNNKYNIRAMVPFIIVWTFSICLFFLLRHQYLHYHDILRYEAFISNLSVIPIFLSKLLIPLGLSPMPVYDICFTAIGIILIILLCVFVWKIKIVGKSLIILGIVWFLGFNIPPLFAYTSFAKVHFHYLECRAYLPSIGIFIVLGVFLNDIMTRKKINIIKKILPVIILFSIMSYIYSADFANLIEFYSSIIKSNPANAFALSQRGCGYLYIKDFELALKDFDRAISLNPAFSNPYFNKGNMYHLMDDHINAEHFLSFALNYDTLYPEINSLNEQIYVNLSAEKLNLGKYDEAKSILKNGISKYPDECSLHSNLGLVYYSTAKFDSAIFEYNKAINTELSEPTYYNYRGMAKYNIKDYAGAIIDFNKALELKPDFLEAWGNRGMSKINMNDYAGAINDLTRALNADQTFGDLWYYRGLAYSKLNNQTNAELDWTKAKSLGFTEPIGGISIQYK